MELIAALLIGVAVFVINVKAYLMGLEHGKELSNGNVPKFKINPIPEAKPKEETTDTIAKGWDNIFSYNGDPQKGDE